MLTPRLLPTTLFAFVAAAAPLRAQCPGWSDDFALPGIEGAIDALLAHDDGSGTRLFAGGNYLRVGDVAASLIAYDGTTWSTVGGAPSNPVEMLVAHDDGTGRALYAGGSFVQIGGVVVNGIARWDGTQWSSLGSGLNGSAHAAVAFDDGAGPALYVAGEFTLAGGVPASRVARWDGASWSAVGSGFNAIAFALAVYDDGAGPQLFASGFFTGTGANDAPLPRVARWDGVAWNAVGFGLTGNGQCLAVHDDGTGPALYVGGAFMSAGGVASRSVARLRNGSWEAAGLPGAGSGSVETLFVHDDGSGSALYAGGSFGNYGSTPFRIARWNGASWDSVGGGLGGVDDNGSANALETFDSGAGPELVVGGYFSRAGALAVSNVAAWDGVDWRAFVPGHGLDLSIFDLALHEDGQGLELVAGGQFSAAGTTPASSIASFDGQSWSAFGSGLGPHSSQPTANALHSFDDGAGPALYVAGGFASVDGVTTNRIARHDTTGWSALGAGISSGLTFALHDYDEGSGPILFAGGSFTNAGGLGIATIARWDGTAWSQVGSGLTGAVWALTVFDAGQGPELFAGGRFRIGSDTVWERVATWNGTSWRTVGFGPAANFSEVVFAFETWHDGTRADLYAAGRYSLAGGIVCGNIARFDGSTWSALGSGTTGTVYALARLDGPTGPGLCAGGEFGAAGGITTGSVARWDGAAWSPIALLDPHSGLVRALATYDARDGHGPALYAGGYFGGFPATHGSYLAAFSDCGTAGRVVCAGDGSGTACPCGNASAPGAGAGCIHSHGSGGTLRTHGLSSLVQDTLVLEGSAMTNGAVLYIQGTQRVAGGAGAVFGDGLRCAGGVVVRLDIASNVGGASRYPAAGDVPVATKGLVGAPGTRVYQAWFRDASSFCTSSTFNLTNAVEIVWQR